jgi:hypothetical protein
MATLSISDDSAETPILRSRHFVEERTSEKPRSADPEKQEGSSPPVSLGGATAVGDENDYRPTLKGRRLVMLIRLVACSD